MTSLSIRPDLADISGKQFFSTFARFSKNGKTRRETVRFRILDPSYCNLRTITDLVDIITGLADIITDLEIGLKLIHTPRIHYTCLRSSISTGTCTNRQVQLTHALRIECTCPRDCRPSWTPKKWDTLRQNDGYYTEKYPRAIVYPFNRSPRV